MKLFLLQTVVVSHEDPAFCGACPMLEEELPGFCRAFDETLEVDDMEFDQQDGRAIFRFKRDDACRYWVGKTQEVLSGKLTLNDFAGGPVW